MNRAGDGVIGSDIDYGDERTEVAAADPGADRAAPQVADAGTTSAVTAVFRSNSTPVDLKIQAGDTIRAQVAFRTAIVRNGS